MNTEYGLITEDMVEKKILKTLNDKLKIFFTEMVDKEFDIYASYKFSKMKNHHGISFNPKQIPWDYEYSYYFMHKHYGISMELYPNTNDNGEQKFKNPRVMWNLYVNEGTYYVRNTAQIVNKSNPDIKRFMEYFLRELPFEVVVLYEYEEGEERI